MIVDVVTARTANLHAELFDTLAVKSRAATWKSDTGLYAAKAGGRNRVVAA